MIETTDQRNELVERGHGWVATTGDDGSTPIFGIGMSNGRPYASVGD